MTTAYGALALMARELLSRTTHRISQRQQAPEATYRLQFHAGFTFRDATLIMPYLRDLGITHVYASPYFKARPGSQHGYDVIDHNQLNPELGTEADYNQFIEAMKAVGLKHIVDFVPNHAGVATNENDHWNDVLAGGPSSQFANHFDISWHAPLRPQLNNKVLLPVLGEPYGEALEKGLLRLAFEDGRFFVHYFGRRFPLSSESSMAVLEKAADGDIDWAVATYNGKAGVPRSFDMLDDLLQQQHFRLAHWRVAADEINYRRFFDINDLAALAMEREEVFEANHRLLFKLLASGQVAGLRIDHPDGLYDPRQYFERLQRYFLLATARIVFEEAPHQYAAWKQLVPALWEEVGSMTEEGARPLYIVAEKILATDENLPGDWPVHGTTGYDFIARVNGLFIDASQAEAFTKLYWRTTGNTASFDDLAYLKKKLVLLRSLRAELENLTRQLDALAQAQRRSCDFTLNHLRFALTEVISCFPVYRTYTTKSLQEADRPVIEKAVALAIGRNPTFDQSVFQFIGSLLLLEYPDVSTDTQRTDQRRFAARFQQLSSPVTARGVEDTAFYLYNRLISLNEVGGDPGQFGTDMERGHEYFGNRQAQWPYALSCLSTHDTKRGEDVRARISVLSELPTEWEAAVSEWRALNAPHRRAVGNIESPDRNEEYLLYQTLAGTWPMVPFENGEQHDDFVHRIQSFMEKALREGKLHSSWTDASEEYEHAVTDFVKAALDPRRSRPFLDSFVAFQSRISHLGMLNSLSQTVLRITAPGVPDTYQGTECWDLSLVDPDNRRPVDYATRLRTLRDVGQRLFSTGADRSGLVTALLATKEDGRIKMLVTAMLLRSRRERTGLFSRGQYIPLQVTGEKRNHVFAFARRLDSRWAIVAVARLMSKLTPNGGLPLGPSVWGDTIVHLPHADAEVEMHDIFTGGQILLGGDGGELAAAELFKHINVAVLLSKI